MNINYFKIAWRNLKKQPFFTFLNTFGLAIGMAGALMISLYIIDELSFDKMFKDSERIYRINADIKFGGKEMSSSEVADPIAATIQKDYPQVELTTRFRNRGSLLLRKNDADLNVKENNTTHVDASFFDMFGIELLYGDKATALKEPNTLVLTRSAAEKHFKSIDAVGQMLVLNNSQNYLVTGVIDDLPENSFLRNHTVFRSMAGFDEAQENNWTNNNFPTFVKLLPGASNEEFDQFLTTLFGKYVIPFAQSFLPGITEEQFLAAGNYFELSSINLEDIHLYSNQDIEMSSNGSIQNVYILSFIALFLIVLASVNFMNLSTAHSLKRAKEVGIRKTLGSKKMELVSQFLTESGMISLISLSFAVALAALFMPLFNQIADKNISIPFAQPLFWIILLMSGILLGILSGLYPAFFMSRFVPVKVLKGAGNGNSSGGTIRNLLVVFQFSISIFLIIGTLVVFKQLRFIQNKELGYNKERVLVINEINAAGNQTQPFKNDIKQMTQVSNASLSSFVPTPSSRSDSSFFEEGTTNQENAVQMQRWRVDFDYIKTLDLKLLVGRDFDKEFITDSTAMIVNEAAVKVMGISPEEAIGKRYTRDLGEENPRYYTIIGVVEDFHFRSLRDNIGALSMMIGNFSNSLIVKLNSGNYSATIEQIEASWKGFAPGQPFNYYFMEESFNNTYLAEQRLGRIFTIFTILSIVIACLGLFGLAAFNAEKRTKEIGIRKVLGASVGQITYKLSIDFMKLVGIAIILSMPLAWYAMNKWLEDFTYRIEIGIGVFALAIFLATLVSILTLSFQSIKAAIVNPIKSLRTE